MKKILFILVFCFFYVIGFGQSIWSQRSTPSVTPIDYNLKAQASFYFPVCAHSPSLNGNRDSLGAMCYVRDSAAAFIRDTDLVNGGHKWSKIGTTNTPLPLVTIYTGDGTLLSDRDVHGGAHSLSFDQVGLFTVNSNTTANLNSNDGSFLKLGGNQTLQLSSAKGQIYADNDGSYISFGNNMGLRLNSDSIIFPTPLLLGNVNDSVLVIENGVVKQRPVQSCPALTWQDVLINGSTLTQNNTITGGGYNWTWNNAGSYNINSTLGQNYIDGDGSYFKLGNNNALELFSPNEFYIHEGDGSFIDASGGNMDIKTTTGQVLEDADGSNIKYGHGDQFALTSANYFIVSSNTGQKYQDADSSYIKSGNNQNTIIYLPYSDSLIINSEKTGTSKTRFIGFNSATPTSTGQPIGVDASGNVVTVASGGGSTYIDTPYNVQRVGIVLSPSLSTDQNTIAEPMVIYDNNPQLLTSDSATYKMLYTQGWGSPNTMYAESRDLRTWVRDTATAIAGHCRNTWFIYHNKYYAIASLGIAGAQLDLYRSVNNGRTWTLKKSNILPIGSGWDSLGVFNTSIINKNDTLILAVEALGTGHASYAIGLYWSVDTLNTLTAYTTNPVISNYAQGGPDLIQSGSMYYMLCHASYTAATSSILPSQIKKYSSPDLVHWTDQGFILTRQTSDEGSLTTKGQIADICAVASRDDKTTFLLASVSPDGSTNALGAGQAIKLYQINKSIDSVLKYPETDNLVDIGTVVTDTLGTRGIWNDGNDTTKSISPLQLMSGLTLSQFNHTSAINFNSATQTSFINFYKNNSKYAYFAMTPTTGFALYNNIRGAYYLSFDTSMNLTVGDVTLHPSLTTYGNTTSINASTSTTITSPTVTHSYSTNGTSIGFKIINTNTGTSASATLGLQNATGQTSTIMKVNSNYSPNFEGILQNYLALYSSTGGISFSIDNSSGNIPFWLNGNNKATLYNNGNFIIGGNGTSDASNGVLQVTGNVNLESAGNKLLVKTGTNASIGTATLSSGTITVNTTAVTASSLIFVTHAGTGTAANFGVVSIGTITAGTSFVINSSNASDNDTVNWWIIN